MISPEGIDELASEAFANGEQHLRRAISSLGGAASWIEFATERQELTPDEKYHLKTALGHISLRADQLIDRLQDDPKLVPLPSSSTQTKPELAIVSGNVSLNDSSLRESEQAEPAPTKEEKKEKDNDPLDQLNLSVSDKIMARVILSTAPRGKWFAKREIDLLSIPFVSKAARDKAFYNLSIKLCENGLLRQKGKTSARKYSVETANIPPLMGEDEIKSQVEDGKALSQEKESPKRVRTGLDDYFSSSYDMAEVEPRRAKDRIESLPEGPEKSLALSVLEDSKINNSNLNRYIVRKALKLIAGTIEVQDPLVFNKYKRLNAMIQSEDMATAEQLPPPENIGRPRTKIIANPFTHPEAACKSPVWHDEEYLVKHVGTFFSDKDDDTKAAKAICIGCPAIDSCLEYALNNGIDHGVWGGMSEEERRPIRRALRKQGKEAAHELIEQTRQQSY